MLNEYNYSVQNIEQNLPDGIFVTEYRLQFQFPDRENYDNVLLDLGAAGYRKINEQTDVNGSSIFLKKDNYYSVLLSSLKTNKGNIYMYEIFNNIYD